MILCFFVAGALASATGIATVGYLDFGTRRGRVD
jgi:hypothetical protein